MSILSSTIPIVYIQNTRTVIDYSGKIIHTKKQGGRVGRCSAEPDTRRKPPEGAAPTADQMRSHLDLDLMATPLWVPVKLSAAREGERFERVIAKRHLARRRVRRRANPPEETLSLCRIGASRVNVFKGNVGFEAPATEPTNFRQRNVQRICRRGGSCANAMKCILSPRGRKDTYRK